jgi:hypothetical protein
MYCTDTVKSKNWSHEMRGCGLNAQSLKNYKFGREKVELSKYESSL